MKFQSIISFLVLYLVSGLSAKIQNIQSYKDIKYSNLKSDQGAITATALHSKLNLPNQSTSDISSNKSKQKVTNEQQKSQQIQQYKNSTNNKPTKVITSTIKTKEGTQKYLKDKQYESKVAKIATVNRSPGISSNVQALPYRSDSALTAIGTSSIKKEKPTTIVGILGAKPTRVPMFN
jgi:hypothetical protein